MTRSTPGVGNKKRRRSGQAKKAAWLNAVLKRRTKMNLWVWLAACSIYWWFGRSTTDVTLLLTDNRQQALTHPPKLLFYVCGAPSGKGVPRGVMASRGLGMQVAAILLALAGLVLSVLHQMSGWVFVVCFVPTFLIGLLISPLSRRLWPYMPS